MKLGSRDSARAGDYYTIALRQYNKAIQCLTPLTSKSYISFTEKQTILLASVLFVGICCMHRNIEHAKLHIANAVELFYQWEFWKYEDLPGTAAVVRPRSLVQLVVLFQYQLTDVGASKSVAAQRQIAMTQATISEHPFTSVTEAYFEFVHIHFGRVMLQEGNDKGIGRYPMQAKQIAYATSLNRWKTKFLELENSQESESTDADLDAIRTLRLLVDCHELCYNLKFSGSAELYVKNNLKLIGLVDAAEEILQRLDKTSDIFEESFSPGFSFSLSICEVLRVVGLTTRSGSVHQRIIDIIKRWPGQDGFLDSQLTQFLIQTKMQFNKLFGIMEVPDGLEECNCVQEVYICKSHQLRDVSMDISEDRVTIQGTNAIRSSQGLPHTIFTFKYY